MDETQPDVGGNSRFAANTSNDNNRLPYYENITELPRSSSAGFNPINHQASPTLRNYSEHSPRQNLPTSGEQNRYFSPSFQNNTPTNNTRQGNQFSPESQSSTQQLESWRMQLPEQPPHYQDAQVTPKAHRTSFDESKHLNFVSNKGGEGRASPVTSQHLLRQHRRGRSDEVARCFEGTPRQNLPTSGEQNRYFSTSFQHDTSTNNTRQGNQFSPESQSSTQQLKSWRMQLPEQPPHYQDAQVTPTAHRTSLDESKHLNFVSNKGGEGRASPVTSQHFLRQHRRGRSDEVARCFEGSPHMTQNVARFGSPPLVRAAPMVHSLSTPSLDQQQEQHRHHQQQHPHNFNHSLHHSASVDNASLYDNMYLVHQNTVYVNLTTGINMAQRKLNELEKEKKKREKELYDLLSVQNDPTEEEYRQLRHEGIILHREISEMYNECDQMNISIDPGRAFARQLPTISFRTPSTPMNRVDQNSLFPYKGGEHLTPVITKHPLPPNYRTISDPTPDYNSLQPEGRYPPPDFFRSASDVPRRQSDPPRRPPPPIPNSSPLLHPTVASSAFQPSRPPPPGANSNDEDEHWECPSCTFKNLLVGECEVCYTRRPKAMNTRLS